jgi:Ca2+-binding EF-hand superfamily protein
MVNRRARGRAKPLLMTALALLAAVPAAAQILDGVDGRATAFDRFMRASRPVCEQRPAEECVALAWRFADTNGDHELSAAELTNVRATVEDWALHYPDELSRPERSSITLGLLLVDSIGVERLLQLYDTNHDGLISERELLADVHLDRRPLGEVLLDPAAVNRAAVARRLGLPSALLDQLQP